MKKDLNLTIAALGVVLSLVAAQPALAQLTNVTFDTDLSGWTIAPDGSVVPDSGAALFRQAGTSNSTLSQVFRVEPLSLMLSFEVLMNVEGDGGAETDTFTATLWDEAGQAVDPVSGQDYFDWIDGSASGFFSKIFAVDVSGLIGQDVELILDLHHEDDGLETTVLIEEVEISFVPVPGVFVLGGLGLSLAGWRFGKRRSQ